MAFKLSDLLEYDDIVIQCHDNPDADALASGFALKWYLDRNGKKSRFIYSGKFPVSKSNLVLMKDSLKIPAEYVSKLDKPQLLVTVDCQYGESNVTKFDADTVVVIDHHQISGALPELNDVRSAYGSCSTVLYELLRKEGIDINEDEDIATALYYGLMTDTNGFTEISHPADKDLWDAAKFNNANIVMFRNSNLSREELEIAGNALKGAKYNDTYGYALVEAAPCDPNILGIISDMLLEVDTVKTCLVYSILAFGVKISVRSCVREVKASELAGYIAEGLGGGGGHLVKAGGFLKKDLIEKMGVTFEKTYIDRLMEDRMQSYFTNSEILTAGQHVEDVSNLKKYRKTDAVVGFARTVDFAEAGTALTVRTIEGDVDIPSDEEVYIILGVEGEVYPCKKAKFERSYKVLDGEYEYPGEYSPAVINRETGDRMDILKVAKRCVVSGGGEGIYARELTSRIKVFTAWDPDKYYLGLPGDFLAVRMDDLSDIYIIAKRIFEKTYEEVRES